MMARQRASSITPTVSFLILLMTMKNRWTMIPKSWMTMMRMIRRTAMRVPPYQILPPPLLSG